MDSGFDENKAEFGVLVLAVTLEVLAYSDRLKDVSDKSSLIGGSMGKAIEKGRIVGITFLINM